MRVLLRADASPTQGTGHVMRCITLSEALRAQGHEVLFMTNESDVQWLEEVIHEQEIKTVRVPQHSFDLELIKTINPDWVVVDSYEIEAGDISAAKHVFQTLAIIDGDSRGISAHLYLDHNLGAEHQVWPEQVKPSLLAGNMYCLVRDSVLDELNKERRPKNSIPHIVAVMGGSDPTGAIVEIAKALSKVEVPFSADVISNESWFEQVEQNLKEKAGVRILRPTPELPQLLGAADISISAAGTSAWELCTLGTPSILISVVDNQSASLKQLMKEELILGIDAAEDKREILSQQVFENVMNLLENLDLQVKLSESSRAKFDGHGKYRVVEAMEEFSETRKNGSYGE